MLPDIRAVIAAVVAALGLLMISFGLVATLRVAQDNHAGSLQADLAQRGRAAPLAKPETRVTVIDTPAPHVAALPRIPPLPVVEIKDAPIGEIRPIPAETPPDLAEPGPIAAVPPPAPAEPRVGGPLAAPKPTQTGAERSAAEKAAARKAAARKARAANMARERKARAAQARRQKEQPALGGSFGSGFNNFGSLGNAQKR